jgi:hypothetical protein
MVSRVSAVSDVEDVEARRGEKRRGAPQVKNLAN